MRRGSRSISRSGAFSARRSSMISLARESCPSPLWSIVAKATSTRRANSASEHAADDDVGMPSRTRICAHASRIGDGRCDDATRPLDATVVGFDESAGAGGAASPARQTAGGVVSRSPSASSSSSSLAPAVRSVRFIVSHALWLATAVAAELSAMAIADAPPKATGISGPKSIGIGISGPIPAPSSLAASELSISSCPPSRSHASPPPPPPPPAAETAGAIETAGGRASSSRTHEGIVVSNGVSRSALFSHLCSHSRTSSISVAVRTHPVVPMATVVASVSRGSGLGCRATAGSSADVTMAVAAAARTALTLVVDDVVGRLIGVGRWGGGDGAASVRSSSSTSRRVSRLAK